jgi:hypothetical protein
MLNYKYLIASIILVVSILSLAQIRDNKLNKVFDLCVSQYKASNTLSYNDYMNNCYK